MRVHVTELKEGDRLASDAFNDFSLHVMAKGTVLRTYDITKLTQHRIDYVDIEERQDSAPASTIRTIESSISPKWISSVQPLYKSVVNGCESLFRQAVEEGRIEEFDVNAMFQPFVGSFQSERDVVSMLLLLNSEDDYTYQHSVQVGMLAYYLSSWLGYPDRESVRIGKAGFLHDIGKCRVSKEVLNKPDKLSKEEFAEIKRHPLYGEEIILASFEDPLLSVAALQHHERMDGSGYPHGLVGDEIEPVSRIVAVADVYSAMISTRVYQKKRDLLFVLKELYRMSATQLDPHTVQTFIKHMIPNFIGKRVEMSSGDTGLIVMTHPTEFFRPLVKLDERFVDLTLEPELDITQVYM
ncbi:HD-GYP domain-containing protein [Paenibacillus beijingensis]|uniref:HD family phosphohydrolase n=1 Tax=Paenibacillus beijingensis TaxID=1126833 RepID=A0A0D5NL18_9BACL|nr:HD-GYP domain-containing protein [Paenibacillus beijingensis]AJY75961.1 HD family phosphohydrolase [Paenibacillus beijingensis]